MGWRKKREEIPFTCEHDFQIMRYYSTEILTDIVLVKFAEQTFFKLTSAEEKIQLHETCSLCQVTRRPPEEVRKCDFPYIMYLPFHRMDKISEHGEYVCFLCNGNEQKFLLTDKTKEQFRALYLTAEEQ